jgi:hypothetical protein
MIPGKGMNADRGALGVVLAAFRPGLACARNVVLAERVPRSGGVRGLPLGSCWSQFSSGASPHARQTGSSLSPGLESAKAWTPVVVVVVVVVVVAAAGAAASGGGLHWPCLLGVST